MQNLLDIVLNTAVITITALATTMLFSLLTMRYWWWVFKIDELVFWISKLAINLNRRHTNPRDAKEKWQSLMEKLMSEDNNN